MQLIALLQQLKVQADLMNFDLANALPSGTAGRGMIVFWG